MPLSSLLRRAVASRGCVSSWCWSSSDLAQAGGVAAASGEGSGAEALCGCGIYIVSAVAARNELRSTVASVDTPRSKFEFTKWPVSQNSTYVQFLVGQL
ncbi:hypothetical protein PF005_g5426 [Phytophthora fragariae]|uniref:Uncharacterized protein n=1 Tax=Phytophthora fragariae TaxID=53985 RepID=A0A6A4A2E7_9STRA|nr:hypothetical protein PF003_g20940 [Phytophthora fragariae]KAE8948653.1 hypothetical protein PF009_g1784 [Phytophthora fragariae]KAE9022870.1 hypothetical protein PF011_g4249 [Phytophthora fragariae]KAE9127685.1 hypothetical protein PF007_g5514 [Phytophthora fragariae]KAE9128023.1 hypothetical protein PF010_g4651 [Phytophthora fragariae]